MKDEIYPVFVLDREELEHATPGTLERHIVTNEDVRKIANYVSETLADSFWEAVEEGITLILGLLCDSCGKGGRVVHAYPQCGENLCQDCEDAHVCELE